MGSTAQHGATRPSTAQYAPAQHAPAQQAPAQDAPAQHSALSSAKLSIQAFAQAAPQSTRLVDAAGTA